MKKIIKEELRRKISIFWDLEKNYGQPGSLYKDGVGIQGQIFKSKKGFKKIINETSFLESQFMCNMILNHPVYRTFKNTITPPF